MTFNMIIGKILFKQNVCSGELNEKQVLIVLRKDQ